MTTLKDRADNYGRLFPNWPAPRTDDRWLDGVWVLGNNYRGNGYYGAYPPGYLKRVMALFPDVERYSKVLHLFSGMLCPGPYTRLDCQNAPDVRGDAQRLPFPNESFRLILADPPYGARQAVHYGVPMPNKRKVWAEAHRVLKLGGHMV